MCSMKCAPICSVATLIGVLLGIQPPTPSYGPMLSAGRVLLETTPWFASVVGAGFKPAPTGLWRRRDLLAPFVACAFLGRRGLSATERSSIMETVGGSDRWLCNQVRVGDSEPGEADTYPLSARV